MQLTSKNVKITGSSDDYTWGSSFSENGLFIILEVAGSPQEPAQNKGKMVLDSLLTKITNYKERDLKTLTELINWAKGIKSIQTLTIGFLHEDILHLVNLGIGEVILQREGKIGKILSSGEISSGKVRIGDTILFASKTFISCIDKDKQQEFLRSPNITDTAQEAYTMLLNSPNSIGAAAILAVLESQIIIQEPKISDPAMHEEGFKNIINHKWRTLTSFVKQKQENLYNTDEEVRSKKTLLTVAVILILLLVASVFLNINYSQSANRQDRLKQTLELVSHQYDEAVSLIDLNPSRARSLLSDGKLGLSQILKDFPKNSNEYRQVNEWLSKIAEEEVTAYRIFKFTFVPLFFDISLIKNGGVGTKMALHKQTAAILDSKNKTVYSLSLDTKKASVIAGFEVVKDSQTIAVHGKSAYLVNSDGIVEIDIPTKTAQVVVKPDKEWGEITEAVAFGGNLYLMDKKNNAIWKYMSQESGFSGRVSYLNPDVKISLAQAGKMIIDGSVWVLADAGTILKFTGGQGESFAFKGLADTISDISTIFTTDENKNLYILDKHTQRILTFDKEGNYGSQYQWEELKNADDILVSEEEKKIYVLSQSKIYAIDIK